MARTLIWNISATAQTLPAGYGGGTIQPGYGWVVSDESSVTVAALGGFAAMQGKWAAAAISTDEALGSVNMGAAGVALIEDVVATIGSGGGGGGGPVSWASITGKPTFSAVATSGAYADLSGKPVLADVATTGSYADLSGTPSLPTASNTAPENVSSTAAAGVQATFSRADHVHAHGNQAGGTLHSAATTLAAGFMSAADKSKLDGLATVATSGSYTDLADKPSLFSGAYADLTGKPSLATVATSGAYADLSGTPALAAVATSGAYADLSGAPSLAAVATSGSANDLADQPYDIIANATGALSVGQTVLKAFAPRNLVLTGVTQDSTTTAEVELKVNGVSASYPQSVSAGALITAVVTVAGTDCWFSVTGKVA